MATTSVTPNAGATSTSDGAAAPAAGSTSTTQPQHSSDRALANFTGGDPDKGGKPAATAPADGTKPAAAAGSPGDGAAAATTDLASLDLKSLLGDDLAAPDPAKPADASAAAAAATTDPNADPLEALKDNPRVIELKAAEATVQEAMKASPEWIKEPAHITAAVQDAAILWNISEGKMKVDAILDPLKQLNPAQHKQVLEDMRAYLLKETGVPVAAAAAGQPDLSTMTQDQKDIYELKKKLSDREAADKLAADNAKRASDLAIKTKEVNDAKTAIQAKLPELLKDSVFDGENDHFFNLVGAVLAPKQAELIAQIQKGDFKLLNMAIKQVRSQEATRFAARIERAFALQKKKAATIPNQSAGGAPGSNDGQPAKTAAQTDRETRLKNMATTLKTGS